MRKEAITGLCAALGGIAFVREALPRRHGRAHRPRQDRAGEGADRESTPTVCPRRSGAASRSTSASRTRSGRACGVSFVDVPGHERFVRNMLAGAGGIDAVLLVVAADESVMPQTREHFEIVRLLGIRRGVVAVTKIDRVAPELVEVTVSDVRELIARLVSRGRGDRAGLLADRRRARGAEARAARASRATRTRAGAGRRAARGCRSTARSRSRVRARSSREVSSRGTISPRPEARAPARSAGPCACGALEVHGREDGGGARGRAGERESGGRRAGGPRAAASCSPPRARSRRARS